MLAVPELETMASSKPIDKAVANIMKWAERPEWSREIDAVFEEHFAEVADRLGFSAQELHDELADNGYLGMLFGGVFEDFASRRLPPEGRNLIDDYLARRGWRESPVGRRYLTALRDSRMSLYEVVDVARGRYADLRDLVRGDDVRRVHERLGTQQLVRWDRLAARVLPMGGKNTFSGGILPFPHDTAEELLAALARVKKRLLRKMARIGGKEAAAKALPPARLNEMLLANACRLFTQIWSLNTVEKLNRPLPRVVNADGEPFSLTETHFPVRPGSATEIGQRLDAAPAWGRDVDETPRWSWFPEGTDKRGQGKKATPSEPMLEEARTIMGTVELGGDTLVFRANSIARTDAGKKILIDLLGGLVGPPLTKIQTLEQVMADAAERPPRSSEPSVPPEDAQRIAKMMMERHYRDCLDERIPALGNKTPRQCIRSKAGRAKVVAWLKYLENAELHRAGADAQGAPPYDFTWMWEELRLTDYR
jgi:hypothetical protein